MTAENMLNLAKAGKLGQRVDFEGYCVSAAIDACFEKHSVPNEVYQANLLAFKEGEIGNEGPYTNELYRLLGLQAFKVAQPEEFKSLPYYFSNIDELRTDLLDLRGKATILLDTNDGQHSVGLKPAGDNPDDWKIVGTHQLVAAKAKGEPLDVQRIIEPKTVTTDGVWEYLVAHNSPGADQQNGLIFPSEPM